MEMDELREAAQKLATHLEQEYGARATWENNCVNVKGSGIRGRLTLDEKNVTVRVELSLLAAPFRSALRQEIERHLDERVR